MPITKQSEAALGWSKAAPDSRMKCVTKSLATFFCPFVSGTAIPLQAIPPAALTVQLMFADEVTCAASLAGDRATRRASIVRTCFASTCHGTDLARRWYLELPSDLHLSSSRLPLLPASFILFVRFHSIDFSRSNDFSCPSVLSNPTGASAPKSTGSVPA